MIDAASGEGEHLRRGVALAGVDCVGGAAGQRVLELLGAPVDGDDLGGPGQMGGGDHLETDAAAADDAHALADPDPGGVGDRAEAGDHPAAQQRGLPERHVGGDRDRGRGGHDRVLRKAGDAQAVLQRLAAGAAQARGAVQQGAGERAVADRLAQRPPARAAGRAASARWNEGQDHVVARGEAGHLGADRLDDPGALVAEHHRPAAGAELAVGEAHVGMADPGGDDPHEHLAGARRIERHRLGGDRPARLTQDAGA